MGIQRFKIHRQAMPVARQLLKRQRRHSDVRRQAYKPSCPASPGLAGNIQACPGNKQGLPRPSIAHTSPSNFCLRNGKAQAHASAARCYQLIMQFFELTSTFFFFFFSHNSLLWFFFLGKTKPFLSKCNNCYHRSPPSPFGVKRCVS